MIDSKVGNREKDFDRIGGARSASGSRAVVTSLGGGQCNNVTNEPELIDFLTLLYGVEIK